MDDPCLGPKIGFGLSGVVAGILGLTNVLTYSSFQEAKEAKDKCVQEKDTLQQKVSQLQKINTELNNTNKDLNRTVDNLTIQNIVLENIVELQLMGIEKLNTSVNELKTENEKLNVTVKELRSDVGNLFADKVLLEDKVSKLEGNVSALKANVTNLTTENSKLAARNKELEAENSELREKLKNYNTTMDSYTIIFCSSTIQKYVFYRYMEETKIPISGDLDDVQMNWLKYSVLSSVANATVDIVPSSGGSGKESGSKLLVATEKDGGSKFGEYIPGETETSQRGFTFSLDTLTKCPATNPPKSDFWGVSARGRPEEVGGCPNDKLKRVYANSGKGVASSLQLFKVKINNY